MKTFRITLKSGLYTDFEVENKNKILEKIRTNKYSIFPVRGVESIIISEDNIEQIEEING